MGTENSGGLTRRHTEAAPYHCPISRKSRALTFGSIGTLACAAVAVIAVVAAVFRSGRLFCL
jgi:hypothetical protein